MALVIDNSVIVGWFVPSQASAYTRKCIDRARRESVFVPSLWETEFANVVLVLTQRRILARHEATTAFRHAARLPLTVDRDAVAPARLFDFGDRYEISAYDAAYLELATRRGIPLASQDARLQRAARNAGLLMT